jgi:hypothetical protein
MAVRVFFNFLPGGHSFRIPSEIVLRGDADFYRAILGVNGDLP